MSAWLVALHEKISYSCVNIQRSEHLSEVDLGRIWFSLPLNRAFHSRRDQSHDGQRQQVTNMALISAYDLSYETCITLTMSATLKFVAGAPFVPFVPLVSVIFADKRTRVEWNSGVVRFCIG